MYALDTTLRKLQAFLGAAATTTNPTVTVVYHDVSQTAKPDFSEYRRAPQFTVLSGTTETDILASPGQGIVRHIDSITIFQDDTVNATVTVVIDDNATNRVLVKHTLTPDQTMFYEHGYGWDII